MLHLLLDSASKTYTLKRNVEEQNTTVETGYFGITLND